MTDSPTRRPVTVAAIGLGLGLGWAAFAVPAAADWLVLTDGTKVETRGGWEERGRRIVFTAADGTLASLQAVQVDLAASRQATETAAAAARARETAAARPVPPPRRATRRFTDADIPRGVPAAPGAAAVESAQESAEGEGGGGSVAGGPPASTVEVEGWEQGEDLDGSAVILGRVRNSSDRMIAAGVRLEVILFGREGQRLAETPAMVVPTTLPPGQLGEFRAAFPGIYDFSLVRFEIASTAVETGEGTPPRAVGADTAAAIADEDDGAQP